MKFQYFATMDYDGDDPSFPNGVYNVSFEKFPTCLTFGVGLEHAVKMAEDVLCLELIGLLLSGKPIPEQDPTPGPRDVVGANKILIKVDLREYAKQYAKEDLDVLTRQYMDNNRHALSSRTDQDAITPS